MMVKDCYAQVLSYLWSYLLSYEEELSRVVFFKVENFGGRWGTRELIFSFE